MSDTTEADSSNSPDPQNAQKDPVIDWDRLEKEFHRTQCWEKPNDYFGTTYQFLATPKSLLNWLKSNLSNYIK